MASRRTEIRIVKNEQGETELTKRQVWGMPKAEIAKALRRFNNWRRGKGVYKWHEDTKKNKPCPYSPTTIGYILEEAINILNPPKHKKDWLS